MLYLNMNLYLLSCIQILEVPFRSGKMTVEIKFKAACQLRVLCLLPQLNHYSKLRKECSKVI
jgi:hypothetical protein